MNREDRIKLAIDKGYTCNPITGEIFSSKGSLINKKSYGYVSIGIRDDSKKYYQISGHQFIWYCVHNKCVDFIDHINTIRDDNRINNLRSVTIQQNGFNRNAKGYSWDKKMNKWKSTIRIDGKSKHLGYFENEQEASQAYQDEKKILHII
jgi:hypothetical protein